MKGVNLEGAFVPGGLYEVTLLVVFGFDIAFIAPPHHQIIIIFKIDSYLSKRKGIIEYFHLGC